MRSRLSKSRSRTTNQMTCSTCGRGFLLDETDAPPFCSERCKLIDLGRWLDEEIGVPHEGGHSDLGADHRSESEQQSDEQQSD